MGMKIDIKENVGDIFHHLVNGKIYKAIIADIKIRDYTEDANKIIAEGTMHVKRTIFYHFLYEKGLNCNQEMTWYGSDTQDPSIFYSTKQDAAKALLGQIGFDVGLQELES